MGLFSSHKEQYVGIDIGTASIKLVELRKEKNRPRLSTYGYMDVETNILKSDTKEAQEHIARAIKKILAEARVSTTKAVSALPGFAVFSSIISLPKMSKKELVSAVRWEAKKFVPMPLEEMTLDWKVLEQRTAITQTNGVADHPISAPKIPSPSEHPTATEDGPVNTSSDAPASSSATTEEFHLPNERGAEPMNVLLTAAPKNLVQRYIAIMKAAGLELKSLETESFAIERSLVGNDPAPVLIVDIGAIATDITVILDKVPILNRSIDVGGNTMTAAIQKSLGVNSGRAEQFKRDFGLLKPGEQTSSVGIPSSLEFVLHSILNEIRYIINLYQTHDPRPMEKIILSGGTAYVPGLSDYLSQALNMKVFVGDPWARVVYPVDLKPVLQEIGPRFSIAVGLAMREITS